MNYCTPELAKHIPHPTALCTISRNSNSVLLFSLNRRSLPSKFYRKSSDFIHILSLSKYLVCKVELAVFTSWRHTGVVRQFHSLPRATWDVDCVLHHFSTILLLINLIRLLCCDRGSMKTQMPYLHAVWLLASSSSKCRRAGFRPLSSCRK